MRLQKKKIVLPLLSILVVDDQNEILQVLELFLADSGFAVDTAISASEALKKLSSKHFDLVISDINMPDMSGLELLRAVRSKDNKTDFILVTGVPDFKAAVTAIKEGAYDYLPKPLNLDDLQKKINRLILDRKNGIRIKTKGGNVGKIRNGYSVIKSIGSGGAGTVFLVEKNDSYFAMKILNNSGSEIDRLAKKRFNREAEILKSLDNAYVVKLFDVGGFEGDDLPYIVMEYVHGAPLSSYIKNANLTDEDKLSVTLQIASGLDYIHSKKILHRDLKPENVLLTEDIRVKITDFGIAKILDPSLTLTDTLRGSPSYMAPEILRGETQGDSKSDIFSFGVLVYELFTGERPFLGKTAHAVMERIKTSKPSAPRSINPEIPEWLQDLMARMLDKTPGNRLASMLDLTKVITHYMANPDDFKSGHSLTKKIFRSILFKENAWK